MQRDAAMIPSWICMLALWSAASCGAPKAGENGNIDKGSRSIGGPQAHHPRRRHKQLHPSAPQRLVMPFRVLYLARHGRSRANAMGRINGSGVFDSLDELGYRQRVGLLALLSDEPIAAIYVSSLPRTRQTAAPIAAQRHLELRPRRELDEFSGGIFEGICKDLFSPGKEGKRCRLGPSDALSRLGEEFIRRQASEAARHPLTYRAPGGGESIQDVLGRLRRFVLSIPPDLSDKTVLVVGHGGTNRFLVGLFCGLFAMRARKIRQKHDQVFRLTRQGKNQMPKVELWRDGAWRHCSPELPDHGYGLDCMEPSKSGSKKQTGSKERRAHGSRTVTSK